MATRSLIAPTTARQAALAIVGMNAVLCDCFRFRSDAENKVEEMRIICHVGEDTYGGNGNIPQGGCASAYFRDRLAVAFANHHAVTVVITRTPPAQVICNTTGVILHRATSCANHTLRHWLESEGRYCTVLSNIISEEHIAKAAGSLNPCALQRYATRGFRSKRPFETGRALQPPKFFKWA